jgi:prepilin-type N-terminal cleavage/methylation domain-containing protein
VKPKTKQQGFSLLEILIALFLIAMMLVLYDSALNAISLSRNAKDQEIALRIASHKMEALRAGGYDSLPSGHTTFTDSPYPSFSGEIDVDDISTRTNQVTVTVTWHEPGNSNDHSVVLDTYITQIGGLR